MKKNRFGKVIAAATLALSLLATSFAFADTNLQSQAVGAGASKPAASASVVQSQAAGAQISWNKAKETFLDRVPGATLKYMRLTRDDGRSVYQGKGVKGSYVYDFEISAKSGKFLEYEKEYKGSKYTASEIGSSFYKSEATDKVLKRVPGARIVYIKLTRDDGRYIYEGEAYRDGYVYDFEMNAYSGKFYEWEKEWAF